MAKLDKAAPNKAAGTKNTPSINELVSLFASKKIIPEPDPNKSAIFTEGDMQKVQDTAKGTPWEGNPATWQQHFFPKYGLLFVHMVLYYYQQHMQKRNSWWFPETRFPLYRALVRLRETVINHGNPMMVVIIMIFKEMIPKQNPMRGIDELIASNYHWNRNSISYRIVLRLSGNKFFKHEQRPSKRSSFNPEVINPLNLSLSTNLRSSAFRNRSSSEP